ncbi:stage II sporulation protein M [Thermomonas sp.]|uniref:stage II sporulation protein M n=1 Tax=Thermomonas sp. TaxID=1971895 RepID=UPI0035ADBDDE
MRQEHFIVRHEAEWLAFEQWLDARAARPRRARADRSWRGLADEDVPAAYRRVCQQLGLARRRGYSPQLVARLQELMQRGHAVMYRPPLPRWQRMFEFFLADMPRLVRAEAGVMWASLALFAIPLVVAFVGVQVKPELIHTVMGAQQVAEMEAMYDPEAARLGRAAESDLMMFGHYIFNNISIGLRTFASGLLAGVGPVLTLAFNGVIIGGVAGHLQAAGHGEPFWRFVAGHAAFELSAIVIAGGAGLRLSLDLIAPGRRRRVDALVEGGRRGARLCLGVFVMLVAAAFIEAFWSSIGWIPAWGKYSVGGALWVLVIAWLWFGGRDRHAP